MHQEQVQGSPQSDYEPVLTIKSSLGWSDGRKNAFPLGRIHGKELAMLFDKPVGPNTESTHSGASRLPEADVTAAAAGIAGSTRK